MRTHTLAITDASGMQQLLQDVGAAQAWLSGRRREKGSPSPLEGLEDLIEDIDEAGARHGYLPAGRLFSMVCQTLWCAGFMVMRVRAGALPDRQRMGFILPDEHAPLIFVNGVIPVEQQLDVVIDGLIEFHDANEEASERRRGMDEGVQGAERFECPVSHGGGPIWHFDARHLADYVDAREKRGELPLYFGERYWRNLPYRLGGTGFVSALVKSVAEGGTPLREACRLARVSEAKFIELTGMLGQGGLRAG